jgi:hypothetical protein
LIIDILTKCSEKGDLTEWNKWRENDQTTFNIKELSSAKIEPFLSDATQLFVVAPTILDLGRIVLNFFHLANIKRIPPMK